MATLSFEQSLVTALQLGQLLKAARKSQKLTQEDIAGRLGLSQTRISYLERNPDELSFKQLLSWCSMVGLELRLGERKTKAPAQQQEW